ncbi:MAG: YjgP/YjgQ family permease [Firmicutes bacterium]|nr:YjgP/YjgQ family permease [Bacillota bacterium]
MDRYIAKELRSYLGFSFAAFTGIFVAGDLLFEAARLLAGGSAGVATVVKIFFLGLPRIAVMTFPMSVLMATLLCFSRLSDSHELVAMVTSGISRRRLVVPAIVLAIVVTFVSLYLTEVVAPRANSEVQEILWELGGKSAVQVQTNVVLKEFKDGKISRLVVAEKLDGSTGKLTNVTLQDFEDGRLVRITTAPRAIWRDDDWQFIGGTIYTILDGSRVGSIRFSTYESRIRRAPSEIMRRQKGPDEMGISELFRYIRVLAGQGAEVRELWVKFHLKLAIPFASIVFALIAAPLGIRLRRSSTSVGFGASIILIFIYYVIMSLGTAFAERGSVSPFLGAWFQNFLFGGIGAFLALRRG